jgi:hypothetical protein
MNPQSDPEFRPSLPAAPKLRKRTVKKKVDAKAEKKKTRTWRDVVLWVVLAVLAVGAAAEFRAQLAYNKALATVNAARERTEEGKGSGKDKHVTFDELKGTLPPDPVYTEGRHSAVKTGIYTWTWQGLRRYKVHVYVDLKTKTIWDVDSEPSSNRD